MFLLTVVAILACVGSGLIAGLFFAFSTFIMRALGGLPANGGLAAMQSINISVINWRFLAVFLGTAVLAVTAIALVLWRGDAANAFFLAGGGLYLSSFLVTLFFNVPLNDALANVTLTQPDAGVRWQAYVAQWTAWNHVRTAAALLAALSFAAGLAGFHAFV